MVSDIKYSVDSGAETVAAYEEAMVGSSSEHDRKFVSALARGMELLAVFRPGHALLGNAELALATGIPKATVTRLTYTLTKMGYLDHERSLGKYQLSASILALGYPFLANLRVRHVGHDDFQKLADIAGGWVGVAGRSKLNMIFVDTCSAKDITTLRLELGSCVTMVNSAVGRAFLGGVSESERLYFFDHFARRLGPAWKKVKPSVEASVAEVHDRGFCIVDGEWHRDVRAVAAPLISPDGKTILAVNCGGPSFVITAKRLENELGPRLQHLCRSIAPMLA